MQAYFAGLLYRLLKQEKILDMEGANYFAYLVIMQAYFAGY
jgi:hypothetical protein